MRPRRVAYLISASIRGTQVALSWGNESAPDEEVCRAHRRSGSRWSRRRRHAGSADGKGASPRSRGMGDAGSARCELTDRRDLRSSADDLYRRLEEKIAELETERRQMRRRQSDRKAWRGSSAGFEELWK